MSSKPWYAWFPADYRAKTAHLSFAEDAAYRRMLDAYYERRGPLPATPLALYRVIGAQNHTERTACDAIASEFFTNGDGLLRHARCDAQLSKEARLKEEWQKAGKRGADSRWGSDRVGHSLGHIGNDGVGHSEQHGEHDGEHDGETHSIPHPHSTLDLNPTPKGQKQKQRHSPLFELPDWIPQTDWDAWVEARTKRRNPPTDYAKHLAVRRLQNFRAQGHEPAVVLAEAAMNGWANIYPPKEPR